MLSIFSCIWFTCSRTAAQSVRGSVPAEDSDDEIVSLVVCPSVVILIVVTSPWTSCRFRSNFSCMRSTSCSCFILFCVTSTSISPFLSCISESEFRFSESSISRRSALTACELRFSVNSMMELDVDSLATRSCSISRLDSAFCDSNWTFRSALSLSVCCARSRVRCNSANCCSMGIF